MDTILKFFQIESEPLTVAPATLFFVGELPVTNTMLMGLLGGILLIGLCLYAQSFSVTRPGRFQLALEQIFNLVKNLITQISGSERAARLVVPLVVTLVIYIGFSNLLATFVPFLTAFTYEGTTLLRTHTNDFNTTFALAFGMIVLVQIYSVADNNPFGHLGKYIRVGALVRGFSKGIGPGFSAVVDFFVGLLDIISEFARIVSLSLRLFGNMFAGELLIGVLSTMLAILLPIPIIGLSILSGAIQAIVFGSLVASYLAGALAEE